MSSYQGRMIFESSVDSRTIARLIRSCFPFIRLVIPSKAEIKMYSKFQRTSHILSLHSQRYGWETWVNYCLHRWIQSSLRKNSLIQQIILNSCWCLGNVLSPQNKRLRELTFIKCLLCALMLSALYMGSLLLVWEVDMIVSILQVRKLRFSIVVQDLNISTKCCWDSDFDLHHGKAMMFPWHDFHSSRE